MNNSITENTTIYALKGDEKICKMLQSLQHGEGRFGWSYIETADLRSLAQRISSTGWGSLDEDEQNCYQAFLLDVKEGDYVVFINTPKWGKCTLARVTGSYFWHFGDKDFNHRFPVDPQSVRIFDRNDANVHPGLSKSLKLQGRYWRIRQKNEFQGLLESLDRNVEAIPRTIESNLGFLSREIQPFLKDITKKIQSTHPNYDLEKLMEVVFKNVPGVIEVIRQGGAGDHGADLLVKFDSGLPILGLEQQSCLVVQIKSFTGTHWSNQAVNDIARAFDHYPEANMGPIISTANSMTEEVELNLNKLREECGKPISLLIGADVAAFVLKYGANLLG